MAYDEKNIYIIAICHLVRKAPYMVESLRRDFVFSKNDNFIFFLDPFNDLTNGYTFGANAAGAQWDGMLYEGGKADLNWDNKWVSVVKNYEDKWIFEAAIPFKTIRYKKGADRWGINFSRLDLTVNPYYSQVEVDKQVTNLDRYELFFPEKRQFFLENNDLFGNFGLPNIRPFFSRRIGLGVPINFGARLSGSIDRNWRIGVM